MARNSTYAYKDVFDHVDLPLPKRTIHHQGIPEHTIPEQSAVFELLRDREGIVASEPLPYRRKVPPQPSAHHATRPQLPAELRRRGDRRHRRAQPGPADRQPRRQRRRRCHRDRPGDPRLSTAPEYDRGVCATACEPLGLDCRTASTTRKLPSFGVRGRRGRRAGGAGGSARSHRRRPCRAAAPRSGASTSGPRGLSPGPSPRPGYSSSPEKCSVP